MSAELAALLIALGVQGIPGAQEGSPGRCCAPRQWRHQSLCQHSKESACPSSTEMQEPLAFRSAVDQVSSAPCTSLKTCDKSPNEALWVECGGENKSGQTM